MAKISSRRGTFAIAATVLLVLLAVLGWEWKRHADQEKNLPLGGAFPIPGGVLSTDKPEELSFYAGRVILGIVRGTGNYYDYSVFPPTAIIQYPPRPASGPGSGGPGGLGTSATSGTNPGFAAAAGTPPNNPNKKATPVIKQEPPKPIPLHPLHGGPHPKTPLGTPPPQIPPSQVLRLFSEADLPANSKFIDPKLLLQTSNGSIDIIRVKTKGQSLTRAAWEALKPTSDRATVVVDQDLNPIARITP